MKTIFTFLFLISVIIYGNCQNKLGLVLPIDKELSYEKVTYNLKFEEENEVLFSKKQSFSIKRNPDYYEWSYGIRNFSPDSLDFSINNFLSNESFLSNMVIKYKVDEKGKFIEILNYTEIVEKVLFNIGTFFKKLPKDRQVGYEDFKRTISKLSENEKSFESAFLSDIFTYHRVYGKVISLDETYMEDFWAISEYSPIKKVTYNWKSKNCLELALVDDDKRILVTKEYIFDSSSYWIEVYSSINSKTKLEFKLKK